jgi:hypothetical protein
MLQGFKSLYDPTLAYKFLYPVQGASGEQLTMTLTRPPEKVSTAAYGCIAFALYVSCRSVHTRFSSFVLALPQPRQCLVAWLELAQLLLMRAHWEVPNETRPTSRTGHRRVHAIAATCDHLLLIHLLDPASCNTLHVARAAAGCMCPAIPLTNKPYKQYSSAAPLSADARQRIVGELFDLRKFVTASVTVGPASGVLKDLPQEQWKPREVALTVLVDRCGVIF